MRTAIATSMLVMTAALCGACGDSSTGSAQRSSVPPSTSTTAVATTVQAQPASTSTVAGGGRAVSPTTAPVAGSPGVPTVTLGSWTGTRPRTIYFSADGGNIVHDIAWSSWDSQSAEGSGLWGHNDCDPSCAEGKVIQYPTTVSFNGPTGGQFTQAVERQTGPFGKTYTFTLPDPSLNAQP
jgi:hypothetical protein